MRPHTPQKCELYVIELESEGSDFSTVFKNQPIALNHSQDLLIQSIMTNLKARGFVLNDEQFISYFSAKTKNYIAAAKNPIHSDATIPKSDI